MILLDSLYKIVHANKNENQLVCAIKLNSNHMVYQAHFPGYPVTPAVIQMQIIHELTEKYFLKSLTLSTVSQAKFLNILNPTETSQINIEIEICEEENFFKIKAVGKDSEKVYFKLSSAFKNY